MDEEIKQALKEKILYILREQKGSPALIGQVQGLIALYPMDDTKDIKMFLDGEEVGKTNQEPDGIINIDLVIKGKGKQDVKDIIDEIDEAEQKASSKRKELAELINYEESAE